jgi:ribA/ribD-fused uncharacterized protein
LPQQITEYKAEKSVVFHKTTDVYGGLSNMAPNYIVQVNSINFFTVEHLYQACKFPLHPNIQEQIINERSPITAKQVSRKYQHLVRQDWDSIRFEVMQWVLEIKLSQNWEKFSSLLLSTLNKDIVEYTLKDKVWGAKPEGEYLVGQNVLGKLLSSLRDNNVKNKNRQHCIEAPNITNLLLYGNAVEITCVDGLFEDYRIDEELDVLS